MSEARQVTKDMIQKTISYRYYIYFAVALAYFLVYFHRTSTAVMATDLTAAFNIAPTAIGLFGSMYFYAYAIGQLPAGILADKWGIRNTMSVFVLLAGIGAIMFGMSQTFSMALVARFLVGLGVGFIYVPAMKFLADWFRKNEFATYSGVLLAVGNIGSLASTAPLVALIAAIGWRNSMTSVGIASLVVCVLLFLVVRNKPVDVGGATVEEIQDLPPANPHPIGIAASVGALVKSYTFWTVAVMFFVLYGTIMGFQGLWASPYLMNVYGLTKAEAGKILMMIPIGMIFGCPISGIIADKVIRSKKKVVMLGVTLNILTWIPLVFMIDSMSLGLIRVLMFIYGFFGGWFVVMYANLKEHIDLRMSGTATGFLNFFVFAGGAVYQQVMGVIVEAAPVANKIIATSGFKNAFLLCLVTLIAALLFYATQKEHQDKVLI
ncbi:MAG: MFS transporter [Syntrophomonadaceae bacterium]